MLNIMQIYEKSIFIFLALLLLINEASCFATACTSDMNLCMTSYVNVTNPNNTICFTVSSNVTGWVGIGMGQKHLYESDIYMGWSNTTGGITIANLKGTSEYVPSINDHQNAWGVPVPDFMRVKGPRTGYSTGLTFSFCRPITLDEGVHGTTITSTIPYLFAYSSVAPGGDIDVPNINFDQHDDFGVFGVIDFLNPSSITTYLVTPKSGKSILVPTPSFNYAQIVQVHATLMWTAWVLCPFVGIFVARYCKDMLGHNWFRIHVGSMLACVLLALGGFVMMFLYVPTSVHFSSNHGMIGLAVLVCMVLQVILGYISNAMWSPDRIGVPWWDKAHWLAGRSLFVLAIVNVQLGWLLYAALGLPFSFNILIVNWTILGGMFLVFVIAEYRVGQVTHDANHDAELVSSKGKYDLEKPREIYTEKGRHHRSPHSPRSPRHSPRSPRPAIPPRSRHHDSPRIPARKASYEDDNKDSYRSSYDYITYPANRR